MTQKHTPGPWEFNHTVQPTKVNLFALEAGRHVGTFTGGSASQVKQFLANASLIAAAPDLLAAIEAALPHVEQEQDQRAHSGNDEDTAALAPVIEAMRAAVAKAKGQTP